MPTVKANISQRFPYSLIVYSEGQRKYSNTFYPTTSPEMIILFNIYFLQLCEIHAHFTGWKILTYNKINILTDIYSWRHCKHIAYSIEMEQVKLILDQRISFQLLSMPPNPKKLFLSLALRDEAQLETDKVQVWYEAYAEVDDDIAGSAISPPGELSTPSDCHETEWIEFSVASQPVYQKCFQLDQHLHHYVIVLLTLRA